MEKNPNNNLENIVTAVMLIAAMVFGGGGGAYVANKIKDPEIKPRPHVRYLTQGELSRLNPVYCLPDATNCVKPNEMYSIQ